MGLSWVYILGGLWCRCFAIVFIWGQLFLIVLWPRVHSGGIV